MPGKASMVAVGTRISPRPPHRSRRALLTPRAPPSGQKSCDERFNHARRPARSHYSDRRGISALCPNRGRLTAVPLGGGPSLHDFRRELAPLFQSLRKYYGLIRLLIHVHARRTACRLPEPARHTRPGMDETSQVPRKELLHVHKVSDCARFFPCKPVRHGTMLPSLQRKEIGTPELDPFRSSILGPWTPL